MEELEEKGEMGAMVSLECQHLTQMSPLILILRSFLGKLVCWGQDVPIHRWLFNLKVQQVWRIGTLMSVCSLSPFLLPRMTAPSPRLDSTSRPWVTSQ